MPLFTDMSVIDHYFINQSIELANNMTYMREAKPLGAKFLSISQYLLSFLPSADLGYWLYLQYKLVFSSHKDLLDFIQTQEGDVNFQKGLV